jgi:hypothetical protein
MGGVTARRFASFRAIRASVKLSSPSRSGCRVARVAGVEAERELGDWWFVPDSSVTG